MRSEEGLLYQSIKNQDKVKINFDKSSKPRVFHKGDTVLLWDKWREKPGKHGNLTVYGWALTLFMMWQVTTLFISVTWMEKNRFFLSMDRF